MSHKGVKITAIQDWMYDMGLSGLQICAYALIYAANQSMPWAPLSNTYLAASLHIERCNVPRVMKALVEAGHVEKKPAVIDGQKTNMWRVVVDDPTFYPTEEEFEEERREEAEMLGEPEPVSRPRAKSKAVTFDTSFIEDEKVRGAVDEWLEYKEQRKEVYTSQLSVKKFHSTLMKLAKGDVETAVFLIDQAIANNWQGVHETREMASVKPAETKKTERVDINKLIKETEAKIRERQRREQENKK